MPFQLEQALADIRVATTPAQLEEVRVRYLGRKGLLLAAFADMALLPPDQRKQRGQELNEWKEKIESAFDQQAREVKGDERVMDTTLPGARWPHGHLHPMTQFSRRVLGIWRGFGFPPHEGPELEEQWFTFDGLNVPADHPARDIQDTFFIENHPNLVLRTHSSTVQLRVPLTHNLKPPFRAVEVGKVYRHEATDATHESMFFQCDGVYVDRKVTMAQLVTTLKAFFAELYPGKRIRIRPSYFPFVEPGIEVDMWWEVPGKEGKWLELLGAGLTHPNVIKAMGLNPAHWQGFAFGMGIDRLAMIEFGLPDIRDLYRGNLEFLQKF